MNLIEFKNRLKGYKKEEIILTKHAEIQALFRDVALEEVKNNILNPEKLVYFKKQESEESYEKYDCYFAYSKFLCHRYIMTLNGKIIMSINLILYPLDFGSSRKPIKRTLKVFLIVTIIKINRDWQKIIEGKI
jgi:hypothetical protein